MSLTGEEEVGVESEKGNVWNDRVLLPSSFSDIQIKSIIKSRGLSVTTDCKNTNKGVQALQSMSIFKARLSFKDVVRVI